MRGAIRGMYSSIHIVRIRRAWWWKAGIESFRQVVQSLQRRAARAQQSAPSAAYVVIRHGGEAVCCRRAVVRRHVHVGSAALKQACGMACPRQNMTRARM